MCSITQSLGNYNLAKNREKHFVYMMFSCEIFQSFFSVSLGKDNKGVLTHF